MYAYMKKTNFVPQRYFKYGSHYVVTEVFCIVPPALSIFKLTNDVLQFIESFTTCRR